MMNYILREGIPYFQAELDHMPWIMLSLLEDIKEREDTAPSHKQPVTYTIWGIYPGNRS